VVFDDKTITNLSLPKRLQSFELKEKELLKHFDEITPWSVVFKMVHFTRKKKLNFQGISL